MMPPPRGTPPKSTESEPEEQSIVGDTTLMTFVVALFAFYQVMTLYGLDQCTC